MKIGMIGLGRMGMNMVRRLLMGGVEAAAYNRSPGKTEIIAGEGAAGAASLEELVTGLERPRTLWMMLPAGDVVDANLEALTPLLAPGDLVVEGGNSHFKDDIRRWAAMREKGLRYLDAGVSGGIWGLKEGYCLMVGGEREDYERITPVLDVLAPPGGHLYCGPAGAGHFVKMVHNGIEYAMMEAYGEGFELLKASPYGETVQFSDLAGLWNRGSVIRSWLLELLESAFEKDPGLDGLSGYVEDSGEGRWTVEQAIEYGVPATSLAHALFKRFHSRKENLFSDRVVAALRREFGGHAVKGKSGEKGE
ncbi:MAG: phosphogluconate dehydrogenase (NAD(+)-dependent, decarboxylating) [Planctomycetota bacterium]